MKNILILGSGGAKLAYHLGILHVIEQSTYEPDLVVGVSAGAIAGAAYATAQTSDAIRIVAGLSERKIHTKHGPLWAGLRYALHAIVKLRRPVSLHNNRKMARLLEYMFGRQVPELRCDFMAGRVCLEDGRYESNMDRVPTLFWRQILASASIPGYWPAVAINNRHYVDGGLRNMLPVGDIADKYRGEQLDICAIPTEPAIMTGGPFEHLIESAGTALRIGMKEILLNDLHRCSVRGEVTIIEPNENLGSGTDFTNKHFRQLLFQGESAGLNHFPVPGDYVPLTI